MLYWTGQLLAFIAGLLGIGLIRKRLHAWLPQVVEWHLDASLVILLLMGLILSGSMRLQEGAHSNALEDTVTALREYSDIAQLEPNGTRGLAGAGLMEHSRLAEILSGAWIVKGSRTFPSCVDSAQAKFGEAIREFPKFPFSYYGIALCKQRQGDDEWHQYAKDAVKILTYTTQISGHKVGHDQALKELRSALESD